MIADSCRIALARIRGFLGLGHSDADLADEMAAHLQMHASELERRGMDPHSARRAAHLAFGAVQTAHDEYRDRRSLPFLDALGQDVRYGLRALRQHRSTTILSVLTLAIGIGGTTAIFSVVNRVLLKPSLDSDAVVWIAGRPARAGSSSVSTLDFLDWKSQNTVFDSLAAWSTGSLSLNAGAIPRELRALMTTPAYFDILHLTTELGRGLQPQDGEPGQDHVVVISHELWVSEFASDRAVIGRVVRLQGEPYSVVGVMNENSGADWNWTEVWCPLAFYPDNLTRAYYWLGVYGRLKTGVSIERARADMDRVAADVAHAYPDSHRDRGVQVRAFDELFLGPRLRESLLVLLAAAGTVLVIGCVNLATLMLARSMGRQREVAIRAALGGGRSRIIRQLVTEHLLLAGGGGLVGLGVATGVMAVLRRFLPPFSSPGSNIPPRGVVAMDGRVLVFGMVVSAASVLLFGVVPSLAAVRQNLTPLLGGTAGRDMPGTPAQHRFRRVLIIAEVAMATVLLSTTGILVRSFLNLQRAETGFQSENVLAATLPMSPDRARSTPLERSLFYRDVLSAVSAVPGVRAAALASVLPLSGPGSIVPFQRVDEPELDFASRPVSFFKMVTPSYFQTIGLAITQGRLFDGRGAGAPHEAMINEALATSFHGADPIGQRLLVPAVVQPGRARLGPDTSWTIVGIVGNEQIGPVSVRLGAPGIYVNLDQSPTRHPAILLRTETGATVQNALRLAVASVNRDQTVDDIRTLDAMKAQTIAAERTRAQLLAVFAAFAVLLSGAGVYGVMAYAVEQQMREFSLEVALGANPAHLMRRAITRALYAAGVGGAIGAAAAYGAGRALSSALVGVRPFDPWTLACVALVMGLTTSIAAIVPARRIAHVDPLVIVRGD
jgi:putative ABC transport system permease protein